ncbi:MAG: ABC transporter substrate-binding protein [Candidatus ainarchaeum sp.]|nr:ABC transporter substrate-binding protein [Candidatus ainarchaeum sp.]
MNKIFGWSIAVVVIAVVIVLIAVFGGSKSDADTIKIGFMAPMSGDMGVYGLSSKGGAELAADDMNWTINGKKIEFIYEDSKCDAKAASEAANKLIAVDGVKYIIGFVCSSEILATAPIAEQEKVINIGASTTSPELQKAGEYSFAMYPLDTFGAKYDAEYIYNKLGKRNVAMLLCLSDWCKGYEKPFTETFTGLGGKITTVEYNEKGAKDLKTQLSKIKETNLDLLYTVEYNEEFTALVTQSKEMGLETTIFSPQIVTEDAIRTLGSQIEGYYTDVVKSDIDQSAFLAKLKTKTGLETPEIDLTAGRSYDAMFMIKAAIEKAGTSTDMEKVKDALLTTTFTGITGYHEFDKDGVPAKGNYVIQKVVDGKLVAQSQ